MSDIYEVKLKPEEEKVVEGLRDKIAKAGMGVSLCGNRLTVRWNDQDEDKLIDVHMVILSVQTPSEAQKNLDEYHRWEAFRKKYSDPKYKTKFPDLFADLEFAQMGRYSK